MVDSPVPPVQLNGLKYGPGLSTLVHELSELGGPQGLFCGLGERECEKLPAGPCVLWKWWPDFIWRLACEGAALNRQPQDVRLVTDAGVAVDALHVYCFFYIFTSTLRFFQ